MDTYQELGKQHEGRMDQKPKVQPESQVPQNSETDEAIISTFGDIFVFSLTPLKKDWLLSTYEQLGERASAKRVIGLAILVLGAIWLTLAFQATASPFSPLWDGSTFLAVMLMAAASMATLLVLGNVWFRVFKGQGNLIAQSYLYILSSANHVLLYWLGLVLQIMLYRYVGPALFIPVLVLGSLYLFVAPWIYAVKAIQKLPTWRMALGTILTGITSGLVLFVYQYLLGLIRLSLRHSENALQVGSFMAGMMTIIVLAPTYLHAYEQRSNDYPLDVSIDSTIRQMWNGRGSRWTTIFGLLLFVLSCIFLLGSVLE